MNTKENKSLLYSKALPILLFLATLFMGMGYAAYTSVSLEVLGTAVAKAQDGVFITDTYYTGLDLNPQGNFSKLYNGIFKKL